MKNHREKANQWMEKESRAYLYFDIYATQLAEKGQAFGAKLIAERIRWRCKFQCINDFKWNNNYTKYVAERWVNENPQYAHLLRFREQRVSEI